ncbi:MAG: Carbamoyltransferase [uncultured Solirubrobacteraceae bacterium]|uniref:Carbamoyltransferase n=1 Tax=uncultured Solirubrobacteraceae bacterium TaxID=1162706 RepID=A0A6J4SQT8_9ACTN|nr:MAG: Carbamoyltransferase [uncultured Solirubrobacteraceae bacterium]
MNILGVNAVFHDPAAAIVCDGVVVAAAEEERFSRRKHGKTPVPFSTWELPEQAIAFCLSEAGLNHADIDIVAYSYDPALATPADTDLTAGEWEGLRTLFVERAPRFLRTLGFEASKVRFVAHHVAHAASAHLASPYPTSAVLVADGRGECASSLLGRYDARGRLETLATQALPHSLGLLYEELTEHLGFRRSSDEYKVMAMASYGRATRLAELEALVHSTDDGGFVTRPVDWAAFAPALPAGGEGWGPEHADLAASVQRVTEDVLLDLATWLHEQTGETRLTMAGGVALNCVANARLLREGPFDEIWVQPAAGDSGTALGAALQVAADAGDSVRPMETAALGRGWDADELAGWLDRAGVEYERPDDIAEVVADVLAADGIVAWFEGRSEFGPRALGHRSLLADPRRLENLERLNDIKGREQFRPVAPMVLEEHARTIFTGRHPSEHMLFVHDVAADWRGRIPAVVHVDGTARVQTVDPEREPLVARMLEAFHARTGVPVVVNTSLNTAGRPIVDDPRDALECFGSAPVDLLAIGPFVVRRDQPLGRARLALESAA